ncbi:MAG: alpha/beta fold hydrolase [Rhizobiales bacterium]|nr:alpha/beta fold hydrolase [Hyphomicrobiales bacterium]
MARVESKSASLDVHILGKPTGRTIVMLPSLGRGAADFTALGAAMAEAGWQVILPEPRGIGDSKGPLEGLTLNDLAEDIAAVIAACSEGPVVLLGHAFGNRLARCVAADQPALVSNLVLLACGGLLPIRREIYKAMMACIDMSRPDSERVPALQQAFFAEKSDPTVWIGDWWAEAAASQSAAVRATPVEDWWEAGGKSMLILQADEDAIALPENLEDLTRRLGDRITIVAVPEAGHAMLPEQPAFIADAVLNHLSAK